MATSTVGTVAQTTDPTRAAGTIGAMLEIESESNEAGNFAVLRPRGDIDAYSVAQFRQALNDQPDGGRLVVDLCNVPFMDSAGLGALIGGVRRIREGEGRVAVYCNADNLVRLLHTTGFNRIVPVEETLTGAVTALNS